jgi:hypothetical protein
MRECCSDSERFISTCKDLQEHGRHPKSLQGSLRHRYCVPRCVPRIAADEMDTKEAKKGIGEIFAGVERASKQRAFCRVTSLRYQAST